MIIPALVMAGGKGKRLGLQIEKPLLPFLGKPLIDWVVEAVQSSEKISGFYVVTSENTPKTEERCKRKGWRILRTDAQGYHDDLRQAVKKAGFKDAVMTIPADLPAITGGFLDKVVKAYETCEKDFLAVFVPIRKREELGLSISSTDEYDGDWYAVSGVNIVNGLKSQKVEKIETSAIITEDVEVLLNINTLKDLEISENIMNSRKKAS